MTDSGACLERAEQFRKAHGYFRFPKPAGPAQLAGWLRHGPRCVYCRKNLIETWEDLFGSAHTDHLLPRKYKELVEEDSNLVLGCSVCNSLKHNYDANRELPEDLRYVSGPSLTDEQHHAILELCQKEVDKRRAEKQRFIEEAITRWNALGLITGA